MKRKYLQWSDLVVRVTSIAEEFAMDTETKIYGVPRGGAIIAGLFHLLYGCEIVNDPNVADFILDDLLDEGRTASKFNQMYPDRIFMTLYNKQLEEDIKNTWLIFPYEDTPERDIEDHLIRIVEYFGKDLKDVNTDKLLKQIGKWLENDN